MSEPILSARLAAAAEMVRKGGVICDVGTDHALLPCRLWLDGERKLIAADINEGPLLSARQTISHYIGDENAVRLVLSDGLDKIDYADDVIIAGMGGELIADIAERCRFKSENTRFILQPMTKADVMRKRLYKAGFELLGEKTAEDGGKVYSVMLWKFTGISREIGEIEALCGKNRDRRYLEKVAEKLVKNAKNMEKSSGLAEEAERLRKTADAVLRIAGEDENS